MVGGLCREGGPGSMGGSGQCGWPYRLVVGVWGPGRGEADHRYQALFLSSGDTVACALNGLVCVLAFPPGHTHWVLS